MSHIYTDDIKHIHAHCGTNLNLKRWVDIVAINSPFMSHADIYNPVELKLCISSVAPSKALVRPQNGNWYNLLCQGIGEMLGKSSSSIKVKDCFGSSIENMNHDQLRKVIECDVYVNGKQFYTNNNNVEVPTYLRSDKPVAIVTRVKSVSSGMSGKVADILSKCENPSQLQSALSDKGPVFQLLKDNFAKKVFSDPKFIKTHSDTEQAARQSKSVISSELASLYLGNLRDTMRRGEYSKKLMEHFNSKDSAAVQAVFGIKSRAGSNNQWNLYSHIAKTVLERSEDLPRMAFRMIARKTHKIERDLSKVGDDVSGKNKTKKKKTNPYPWGFPYYDRPSWWKQYYYPTYGSLVKPATNLPAPSKVESPFRGNYCETVRFYQIFSGIPPCPVVEEKKKIRSQIHDTLPQPRLVPIGHVIDDMIDDELPDLVQTNMPELVSIDSNGLTDLSSYFDDEGIESNLPELVPIGNRNKSRSQRSTLPELVPIGNRNKSRNQRSTLPELVPIGNRNKSRNQRSTLPELVPIGNRNKSRSERSTLPELVPIGNRNKSRAPRFIPYNKPIKSQMTTKSAKRRPPPSLLDLL